MPMHLIVHMMSPLDGRLDATRWNRPRGVTLDDQMEVYNRLHRELVADAWIVGSTTMREFATGSPHPPPNFARPPRPLYRAPTQLERFAVAIDRRATLHRDGPSVTKDHVVVLLGASVSDEHLAKLVQDGISFFVLSDDELSFKAVLDVLAEQFEINRLLLEGGGRMIGAALEACAVDEFSLVLFPSIDGRSGSSTIVEAGHVGLTSRPNLRVLSHEDVGGGALWMRYTVDFSPGR